MADPNFSSLKVAANPRFELTFSRSSDTRELPKTGTQVRCNGAISPFILQTDVEQRGSSWFTEGALQKEKSRVRQVLQ